MRFRRRQPPDQAAASEYGAREGAPAAALDLTHAELERLVEQRVEAHPTRAADWRWYLDYLRDRVDADGHILAEYRLLLRLVYYDLPGLPAVGGEDDREHDER